MKKEKCFRLIYLSRIFLIVILMMMGCAAPYKLMPEFENRKDQIRTIALYPLYFSDKGNEQYLFGNVFKESFYNAVKETPVIRPIDFIIPDSTVSQIEKKGVSIVTGQDSLAIESDSLIYFHVYKQPTTNEIQQISEIADAMLYCDLKLYNEVEFAKQMTQAMVTACLTLGTVSVFEKAVVHMDISLIETKTAKPIWTYTPRIEIGTAKWKFFPKFSLGSCLFPIGGIFGPEGKSLEEQRNEMTEKIIKGFRKGFPFSKTFQTK